MACPLLALDLGGIELHYCVGIDTYCDFATQVSYEQICWVSSVMGCKTGRIVLVVDDMSEVEELSSVVFCTLVHSPLHYGRLLSGLV